MWGGYDDTILHRLGNINRVLLQGKTAQSYTIKCRAFGDERILYYQNDLGVNMKVKELKTLLSYIDDDEREVKVEIQEDGMGIFYPLSIVHLDGQSIFLLGGDKTDLNEFEVGVPIETKDSIQEYRNEVNKLYGYLGL